jgi:hypothetical protein
MMMMEDVLENEVFFTCFHSYNSHYLEKRPKALP